MAHDCFVNGANGDKVGDPTPTASGSFRIPNTRKQIARRAALLDPRVIRVIVTTTHVVALFYTSVKVSYVPQPLGSSIKVCASISLLISLGTPHTSAA